MVFISYDSAQSVVPFCEWYVHKGIFPPLPCAHNYIPCVGKKKKKITFPWISLLAHIPAYTSRDPPLQVNQFSYFFFFSIFLFSLSLYAFASSTRKLVHLHLNSTKVTLITSSCIGKKDLNANPPNIFIFIKTSYRN